MTSSNRVRLELVDRPSPVCCWKAIMSGGTARLQEQRAAHMRPRVKELQLVYTPADTVTTRSLHKPPPTTTNEALRRKRVLLRSLIVPIERNSLRNATRAANDSVLRTVCCLCCSSSAFEAMVMTTAIASRLPRSSSLLEPVLFALVKEIGLGAAEVDDLGTPVTVFL